MAPNRFIHRICMIVLPLAVLLVGYFLVTEHPVLALFALIGVLVPVRLRSWMGYKGPRQTVFASHLALTHAFLFSLILLALGVDQIWVRPLSHVSFVGMVVTGALLVRQSWVHPSERV